MPGGSARADDIADRIEAALARLAAAQHRDHEAAARLAALESVVEASIDELDILMTGTR